MSCSLLQCSYYRSNSQLFQEQIYCVRYSASIFRGHEPKNFFYHLPAKTLPQHYFEHFKTTTEKHPRESQNKYHSSSSNNFPPLQNQCNGGEVVLVVYFPLTGQFTFASTVAKPGLLHHTPHPSTSSTTSFNTLGWKPILPALTTTPFLALFFFFNLIPIYTIFASFHFLISCFQEFLLFMEQGESLISKI